MKILIVENEIYLAQSIANKLSGFGYECEFAATTTEALKDDNYDVVLLSTNISGQNFLPVVHRHKHAIVILMVSYINNDTVAIPLKEGAKDYILKPFMIEELVRKIDHFLAYTRLKKENNGLNSYIHTLLAPYSPLQVGNDKLPLLLKAKTLLEADAYVFTLAKERELVLDIIHLGENILETKPAFKTKSLTYFRNIDSLKPQDKEALYAQAKGRNSIFSSTNLEENATITMLMLESHAKSVDFGEIMEVEEYIKYAITLYQDKYPDTELSKKLGISRKSLWEKRKKYDLVKKK